MQRHGSGQNCRFWIGSRNSIETAIYGLCQHQMVCFTLFFYLKINYFITLNALKYYFTIFGTKTNWKSKFSKISKLCHDLKLKYFDLKLKYFSTQVFYMNSGDQGLQNDTHMTFLSIFRKKYALWRECVFALTSECVLFRFRENNISSKSPVYGESE